VDKGSKGFYQVFGLGRTPSENEGSLFKKRLVDHFIMNVEQGKIEKPPRLHPLIKKPALGK